MADPVPGTEAGGELLCVAAVHAGQGSRRAAGRAGRRSPTSTGAARWSGSLDRRPGLRRRAAQDGRGPGHRRPGGLRRRRCRTTRSQTAYAEADVLVLASRAETYGMVVTEALAHGLPVIASAVGGVPEALGHGDDGSTPGLLVRPDDPDALADGAAALAEDPRRRRRLRRSAGLRRLTLTGWSRTTAQLPARWRRPMTRDDGRPRLESQARAQARSAFAPRRRTAGGGGPGGSSSWLLAGSSGPGRSSTGCGRPARAAVLAGAGRHRGDHVVLRVRWSLVAGAVRASGVPAAATAYVAYYRSQLINATLPGGVVGDVHRAVAARLARRGLGARRSARLVQVAPGRCCCCCPVAWRWVGAGRRSAVGRWLARCAAGARSCRVAARVGRTPAGVPGRGPRRRRRRCRRSHAAAAGALVLLGCGDPAERRRVGTARGCRRVGVRGVRARRGRRADGGGDVRRAGAWWRRCPGCCRPREAPWLARPNAGPTPCSSCGMSLDGYLDDATDQRLLLSNDADFDRVDEVRAEQRRDPGRRRHRPQRRPAAAGALPRAGRAPAGRGPAGPAAQGDRDRPRQARPGGAVLRRRRRPEARLLRQRHRGHGRRAPVVGRHRRRRRTRRSSCAGSARTCTRAACGG